MLVRSEPRLSPSTLLVITYLCVADIRGGLGPYLSTWLAGVAGWDPLAIGTLNMAATIVQVCCSGPAGMLVDLLGRPRLMLVLACGAILGGSLAVLPLQSFWPVLASQVVVFLGGTIATPALTALTLGVVGKRAFARQFGSNQAADHAGNMAAALAVALLGLVIGTIAPFVVVAATAIAAIMAALRIPRAAIDDRRARGRDKALGPVPGLAPPSSVRELLTDRPLLELALVIALFDLGNDQVLPLLGQRWAIEGDGDPITWMAVWILVAQLTMIPMSFIGARIAERRGVTGLLLVSCGVLAARSIVAAATSGPWWVLAIEVMDGIGAGLISVTGPIAITNLTYGGGRSQTALGSVGAMRGAAAAISALVGGAVAGHLGWSAALALTTLPPLAAIALLAGIMRQQGRPGVIP